MSVHRRDPDLDVTRTPSRGRLRQLVAGAAQTERGSRKQSSLTEIVLKLVTGEKAAP